MAQAGPSGETAARVVSLKRKRVSIDDEDLLNMPPNKISPKYEESASIVARDMLLKSSSPDRLSRDEDVPESVTEAVPSEPEFTADDLFSLPSLSECPSSVQSIAECIQKGDSTPHSSKRQSKANSLPVRKCPFPWLSWADAGDVWKRMCDCDERSTQRRDPNMFSRHPNLEPRMRTILFDWLNEVCEVYKLHRETYHLTVDYVDRYLASTEKVQKGQLQLLGITSLFIAAKVEEVYPPKITEFAYVTDGACTQEDILQEEVCILKVLSWSLTPITGNEWLNVYMQLFSESRSAKRRLLKETDAGVNSLRGYTFVLPQYTSLEFAISAQLIDFAVLHVDVNAYPYSVVAAAAIAHTYQKDLAVRVSGYQWEDIEDCYTWLTPFVEELHKEGTVSVPRQALAGSGPEFLQRGGGLALICPDINLDESHRIQIHNVCLDMFDRVKHESPEPDAPVKAEPTEVMAPPSVGPLTPPRSDQKSPARDSAGPTPSTSGRGASEGSAAVQ